MQMEAVTILTVLWSFCWMIQDIAGNPVRPSEMRQSVKYGPPLTEKELNCIPKFSKSATYGNYSEGNDVLPMPFDGKNAQLGNKWPNPSRIPYQIDSTFDAAGRCAIGNAMNGYHKNTCIRFVPRTNEVDYVEIIRVNTTEFSCSSTRVGYFENRGPHKVSLSPACYASQTGTTMHELMHRIGFKHEHTRPDRDNYVDVIWKNIPFDYLSQYAIADESSLILSYDYGSVMHYTMGNEMKPKQDVKFAKIGQRNGLSKLDIMKLNRMYCKL